MLRNIGVKSFNVDALATGSPAFAGLYQACRGYKLNGVDFMENALRLSPSQRCRTWRGLDLSPRSVKDAEVECRYDKP